MPEAKTMSRSQVLKAQLIYGGSINEILLTTNRTTAAANSNDQLNRDRNMGQGHKILSHCCHL